MDKQELCNNKHFHNALIFQHGNRNGWNDENDVKYDPSGKIVMCVACLRPKGQKQQICWKKHHFDALHASKNSVIDAHNSHHGSAGYHFSFGNKANYKMVNGSSVAQYASKKGISKEAHLKCVIVEELISK